MKGTIFIAGIHGVGKTTASSKITERYSVPNFTASQIIKKAKISEHYLDYKRVEDVDGNQQLLINGIKELLKNNDVIILDGHFTLLNLDLHITKIKLSVFEELNLIGVILLLEKPSVIHERLINRDVKSISREVIKKHQTAEIEYAKIVSAELNIPIITLNNYDDGMLFSAFEDLFINRSKL